MQLVLNGQITSWLLTIPNPGNNAKVRLLGVDRKFGLEV